MGWHVGEQLVRQLADAGLEQGTGRGEVAPGEESLELVCARRERPPLDLARSKVMEDAHVGRFIRIGVRERLVVREVPTWWQRMRGRACPGERQGDRKLASEG